MTNCFSLRFVTLACAFLLSAAATTPAGAQIRIDRDQTGRVVTISGLPTASGCVRGTGVGRVVDRKLEKGELHGFTFNEAPYGDGYINLPAAYDIKDRAAYARLRVAFDDLLRKDARLKIRSVACGAAGRIVELVSATLVDDPPAPKTAPAEAPTPPPAAPSAQPAAPPPTAAEPMDALLRSPDSPPLPAIAPIVDEPPPATASPPKPAVEQPTAAVSEPRATAEPPQTAPRKPSRWRLSQPTKAQVVLQIHSNDRAFGLELHCSRKNGRILFSNWFLPPRDWNIAKSATPVSIDGRPLRWEVDGADEGLVFSDSTVDNTSALSANALDQLARGQRLVVNGRTDRGRQRDAVFDTAGGEGSFAAFSERCQKLPRG